MSEHRQKYENPIRNNNVLTKLIVEIWECSDITTMMSNGRETQVGRWSGFKQSLCVKACDMEIYVWSVDLLVIQII